MTVLTVGTVYKDIKYKTKFCRELWSYFENFDVLPNFPEAWLLVINWYKRVTSQVTERFKESSL